MVTPNLQQIMEKFTRAVAMRCYTIEVEVDFDYYLTIGFKIINGRCHTEDGKKPLITFNSAIFKKYESEEWSWYLIIHEVSHLFKEGIGHSKEYWEQVATNFQKTLDLREQFFKETGLDGDAYIDFEYEEYSDPDIIEPEEGDIIDYEYLDLEPYYFDLYTFPGEID